MSVWKSDLGNGMYRNPVLYADYSDPDIVKKGEDYFMVASSFTYLPGVPVLHSKDLINWRLINYCVRELPFDRYAHPQHGCGTWAPAIRVHEGTFYVFIPLPDEGIFVTTAKDPFGEWSPLHCIKETAGWIDPCPFWDEDGQAYMIHAFANSRCGIKSKLNLCRMTPDAKKLLDNGTIVFDGELSNPTVEGPKLYKRNGYYYIFAPAGGVKPGWQLVLRSRGIYGPYEPRIVMHQGNTEINGPHQGGYVEYAKDKFAFIHFQDVGAFGRILHLQPMCWHADWPFIGLEQNGDGIGEPVASWKKMIQSEEGSHYRIAMNDEFNSNKLGLQWQWQANPKNEWYRCKENCLQLNIINSHFHHENTMWLMPNVLTQIPQAPEFTSVTIVELFPAEKGDMFAFGMLGLTYSYLAIIQEASGLEVSLVRGEVESKENPKRVFEEQQIMERIDSELSMNGKDVSVEIALKMTVKDEKVSYAYSVMEIRNSDTVNTIHHRHFIDIGETIPVRECVWTGAKVALAAMNSYHTESNGYAKVNSIRFENLF